MDKNGQRRIPDVSFRPVLGTPAGIEVCDFAELPIRARNHGVNPFEPARLTFHTLITVRSGRLRHIVDVVDHTLGPDDWLWVRPGQVHQFTPDLYRADGLILYFSASYLDTATVAAALADEPIHQRPVRPASSDRLALHATSDLLRAEYQRKTALPDAVRVELARHLLTTIVLRLAHLQDVDHPVRAGGDAFHRFRRAVEQNYMHTHRVADYARELGYSTRTLTRAALAATGHGAKTYIDDRVLLEAKRLLVHTDLPAAAIGARVGLPDPTAFNRFFRQRTGTTPAAFRTGA
ncbi:helix-turn-helix domain-containing protein [Nocardia transvalensis]|uniref:helix-turn-helix domain-containing protein n=1 Tax=Nocardia transvalensis TaxID=37333 RepID=UPI001893EE9B|nr:AraC family transcriptional regulator [Nocardia transvalensis]MBF6328306.1 helix-turn-helix transcriptional regulator [Nocardia transvalensis]